MTEKLYTDFTNKVLPAIQEGLVITQEYFTELFSRSECCDGSDGCPCRGQPYFPWTCSVCKGSGKGNAFDFLRTALEQRDEEWRELVGYVRESAESCAVLARENESNNIRNNIIRPLDDIITKSKEI